MERARPGRVRLVDTWGGGDCQEFTSVSPAQWEEFLLTYQLPLFELYGLVGYGCCESLVGKLEILRVNGHPETLTTWVRVAKEVGAERYHRR